MSCKKWSLALFVFFWTQLVIAQSDTSSTAPAQTVEIASRAGSIQGAMAAAPQGTEPTAKLRSPRKATLMSVALPGLGQVYNRKYWKVPIIYGGFALTAYYLRDNLQNIDFYKKAIIADINMDVTSPDYTGLPRDVLNSNLDTFTQWRDLSYITFAIIYILNIVDANVDAHLAYFDISEDISFQVKPAFLPMAPFAPGLTLCMKL